MHELINIVETPNDETPNDETPPIDETPNDETSQQSNNDNNNDDNQYHINNEHNFADLSREHEKIKFINTIQNKNLNQLNKQS